MGKKVVFIIVDGMADLPMEGKTPLSEASKPNMDWLAKNGSTGEISVIPSTMWTDGMHASTTHIAHISLFGYDPKKFNIKRGPLEAVGADVPYQEGHLALRCNFATVDKDMKILDRRAGRQTFGLSELARYINQHVNIGVPFAFMRTYEHRAVLIVKMNLSDKITSNDPYSRGGTAKEITAQDKDAVLSAKIVQDFVRKTHDVIEYHPINSQRADKKMPLANYILVREPGNQLKDLVPHFTKKYKVKRPVCIAESGVVKAIGMLAGMEAVTVPELPFKETLDFIFENIDVALEDHDFVFAHIKGPIDEAAHDGDFDAKKEGIEMIDEKLTRFKNFNGVLAITCDHITSTELKKHMPGKVPVLVYGKGKDATKTFDEVHARKGKMKNFTPSKLMSYLLK